MNKILEQLKALSDRNRLRVVAALFQIDELCACQVVELLEVTGATASRHMGLLVRSGIVESRKEGRWVYYRIAVSLNTQFVQWLETELKNTDELEADRRSLMDIVSCDPEELCRKQRGVECCPNP